MASLLAALLKVDEDLYHTWPQEARRVLMSALYDALAQDISIQSRLVETLINRDLESLNELYEELSAKVNADYEAFAKYNRANLPRQSSK